ncbi:RNA-directed DNA polymerase, eukaryota, reverse transcriptase zinc-binding domain protein [Tanacetum coccineum]
MNNSLPNQKVSQNKKYYYASTLYGDADSKVEKHEIKRKHITLSDEELVQVTDPQDVAIVKLVVYELGQKSETNSKMDIKFDNNKDANLVSESDDENDIQEALNVSQEDNDVRKAQEECIHGNEEVGGTETNGSNVNSKSFICLSRTPSFEHYNFFENEHSSSSFKSKSGKCPTHFEILKRNGIRGISVIHEISRLIEVGEKLGYDVKGCHNSLQKLIDRIGVLMGRWTTLDSVFFMINVYGPQETGEKIALWNRLLQFISNHKGHFVLFRDLNEVRDESERYGTEFHRPSANNFNAFITDAGLLELPLGVRNFTWMNKACSKMSKLDHFLISQHVTDIFPDVKVMALPRGWSHHSSILLYCDKIDYGPWDLLKVDVVKAVRGIFDSCEMPKGTNSSFITLIPKIANPIHINDFRPISLIGMQYKIIAKVLANRLSKVIDKVVCKEQSVFISGRFILDGPLMLSEIMSWYKKKKRNLMFFKVDFEKAFDTVSWKFLDHMLSSLGFGNKWRKWINACLHSARASVLINGSPTSEFSIKRGLRQGDPLSPFLFIIVMEGLHIALQNAVSSGLIQGASIGDSGYNISYIFYSDDVVIILDWNRQDMINIIHVLHVFYLASSLKINVSKSNVYGLGLNQILKIWLVILGVARVRFLFLISDYLLERT